MDSNRGKENPRPRRKLLCRIEIDSVWRAGFEKSELLHIIFSKAQSESLFESLDGNKTIVWLAPSGQIGTLLVQDYVGVEGTRLIPFPFGDVEIINDGSEIKIFLISTQTNPTAPFVNSLT